MAYVDTPAMIHFPLGDHANDIMSVRPFTSGSMILLDDA